LLIKHDFLNLLYPEPGTGKLFRLWIYFLIAAIVLLSGSNIYAQWVNNPEQNTKIAVDAVNPINISSIDDQKGGAFILWEENKDKQHNDIYFLHLDGNGKVSFRADGKKISVLNGAKSGPVAVSNSPNTAVVVYRDFSRNKNGELCVQKVLSNGNYLWDSRGIQVSGTEGELGDYSIAGDKRGNVYVAYLTRDINHPAEQYKIMLQKVTANGRVLGAKGGINAFTSPGSITQPIIIPDQKGGVFLFWLENQNNKSIIYTQRFDSTGNTVWGKKPLNISGTARSVTSYSVNATDYSSIYIAWQVQNKDKDIYHQLISTGGKILWEAGGKLATTLKGDQVNPQVLTEDSTIILSWTNEFQKDRNVFIQKYNQQGKPLWKNNGLAVVDLKGAQFGQKLITDGKGGAIVSWIDRRIDSLKANIYAQRVTTAGKTSWAVSGIPVASKKNTEKSYLSMVSDKRGGAIFIFKDRREGKGEIYGQKVFNTGTYVSQLIGFNAEVIEDSVKISWYSANELGETQYDIERTSQSDSSSTGWELIGTMYSEGESSAKYFEYYDKPHVAGTVYYRVIQSDDKGNFQPSDVAKLVFLEAASKIVVGQNSPNPFSGETQIEIYVPQECDVTIEFFNSRVEEVKKIDNTHFHAGKNKIKFSASGLQSGIYFYKVQIGDFVDVKKMVVTNK
jgi:hypothetical protein